MPAFIDLPSDSIESAYFVIAGWVAATSSNSHVSLTANGISLPFKFYDRPDVNASMGGGIYPFVSGLIAEVQIATLPTHAEVTIELRCDDEVVRKVVRADAIAATLARRAAGPTAAESLRRAIARAWCEERLICAQCRAPATALRHQDKTIICRACNASFSQTTRAVNMISSALGLTANVVETENVSANPYTPEAQSLIEQTVSRGGWVLDCGAGFREERMDHVINLEIVDYPSTDILAVGEALPFADESFDAVVSLAVLEHVRDPFRCAQEILRVLKPGGEILADVPFLQPLHGYPNHYYNMSQQGLANLFSDQADILSCTVPLHGHPIFMVQWVMDQYLQGLPDEGREMFARMTVGELAALKPHTIVARTPMTALTTKSLSIIACLNSLRARKR